MKNIARTSKGFTLIELLIVITIIGILAVALLPQILGGPARARDAGRQADLNAIVTALEQYAVDHESKYPETATSASAGCLPKDAIQAYFPGGAVPMGTRDDGVEDGCESGYTYCSNPTSTTEGAPAANTQYLIATKMETASNNNAASVTASDTACEWTAPAANANGTLHVLSRGINVTTATP